MEDVISQLSSISKIIGTIDKRFDDMDKRVNHIYDKINDMEGKLAGIDGRLIVMESKHNNTDRAGKDLPRANKSLFSMENGNFSESVDQDTSSIKDPTISPAQSSSRKINFNLRNAPQVNIGFDNAIGDVLELREAESVEIGERA